jgi:hypothetical protein
MSTTRKRIGRPMKPPVRGRRTTITLMVSHELKRRIDGGARQSGRSQSQEAERLIQTAFNYERVLVEHQATLAKLGQMRQGNTEQILRELGWQQIFDLRWGGHIWLPPGRLEVQKTGWVDPNDHTPLAPPKLHPDPTVVDVIAKMIAEAIVTKFKEGEES